MRAPRPGFGLIESRKQDRDDAVDVSGPSARAFLQEVVGRDLLTRASVSLTAAGIQWMPLKGIWLQLAGVYAGFGQRPMSDVDVLVPAGTYGQARRVLLAAGFSEAKDLPGESTWVLDQGGFGLDLHERLFTPACFDLGADAMFARALPPVAHDGLLFSPPSPLDGFAHLVGHFVRGGRPARDPAHCRDFGRIIEHWQLDAGQIAVHLERAGMGRAARFALTQAAATSGDLQLLKVVDALCPDPVGAQIASMVSRVHHEQRLPSEIASVAGMLLSRDLGVGLSAIATQLRFHASARVDRIRSRIAPQ